ncbi:MAG TPA: GYD domain-containing protein [Ktedonobacteraceae bacterium]
MPHYLFQFTYTPEAWATLSKKPQDRTEAVRGLVEQYGGRLLAFYYCFGEYDGVLLLEAPDDLAAAAASVAGMAAGHLKVNHTTKLLTAEEGQEVMRRAGGGSFQRPT